MTDTNSPVNENSTEIQFSNLLSQFKNGINFSCYLLYQNSQPLQILQKIIPAKISSINSDNPGQRKEADPVSC